MLDVAELLSIRAFDSTSMLPKPKYILSRNSCGLNRQCHFVTHVHKDDTIWRGRFQNEPQSNNVSGSAIYTILSCECLATVYASWAMLKDCYQRCARLIL